MPDIPYTQSNSLNPPELGQKFIHPPVISALNDVIKPAEITYSPRNPYFSKPIIRINNQQFNYVILGGDRPAPLLLPAGDDGQTALPLIILLHGTNGNGVRLDKALGHGLSAGVNSRNYRLMMPVATLNKDEETFWGGVEGVNKSPAVDDIAYLKGLLEEAREKYPIDESRVYVIGNSIGGITAFRLACAIPDQLTAIVAISAAMLEDASECQSGDSVGILNIHGKADYATPHYDADYDHDGDPKNPAAKDDPLLRGSARTLEFWARKAGCDTYMTGKPFYLDLIDQQLTQLRPFNVEKEIGAGEETVVVSYKENCPQGLAFENWIHDAGHRLFFESRQGQNKPEAGTEILNWLFQQYKPQNR